MRLAIFGAAGRTGIHLIEQALAAGHDVAVLVRTPANLTAFTQHERLTVLQGDARDPAKVAAAIAGAEAVVSVLGPTSNEPVFAVSKSVENILAAMKQHCVRRLVLSAGAGVGDPNDRPQFIHQFFNFLVKTLSRHVYEDMLRVVEILRGSAVDWTIVRVPMLTDGPRTGVFRVGYVGDGPGLRLSRADMADFMLQQLRETKYRRKAPVVSN